MAEDKTTNPVAYGDSTYSNGGLVDALDNGMHNNATYIESLGELNGLLGEAQLRTAAMTDPEVAANYEQLAAELHENNDQWLEDAYDQLSRDCRINAVLNGTALAVSAASATASIGGAVSRIHAGANQAARWSNVLLDKAGSSTNTLAKVGLKTAGYSLKAGEALFGAAQKVSGLTKANHFKTNMFRLAAGTAIEVAPTALPILAAHVYTAQRTEDVKEEYVAAIRTQQGVYDYLCDASSDLSEDIREDYSGWQENYAATQAELLQAFNSGEITKAEYDEKYQQFLEDSQKELDELTEKHKEQGQYILNQGSASAMGEEIITHGYDPLQVSETTPYLKELAENNPEQFEATKAAVEARQATSSGNAFVDFLANMNATLVHYCPAVAYVEAAVLKGADVMMDFVANKVPVVSSILNYEQKHEHETISEMASAISDTAEARYEAKREADAMADAVSEGKDWQQEASDGQPSYGPA